MIRSRGAAANTTIFAAAKRDSAIFMLFRYLHAFLSPEPFNAFVIRLPATLAQGIINSGFSPESVGRRQRNRVNGSQLKLNNSRAAQLYITTLEPYPNQNSPTDSGEEAKIGNL